MRWLMLALSSVRLKGRRPPHCRRSYLNVVYSAVTTPEFRPQRARASDPNQPLMIVLAVSLHASSLLRDVRRAIIFPAVMSGVHWGLTYSVRVADTKIVKAPNSAKNAGFQF